VVQQPSSGLAYPTVEVSSSDRHTLDRTPLGEGPVRRTDIQGVPGGMDKIRESVPYVKIYRYNPKHQYPKLNGYGDNGQRCLKL